MKACSRRDLWAVRCALALSKLRLDVHCQEQLTKTSEGRLECTEFWQTLAR